MCWQLLLAMHSGLHCALFFSPSDPVVNADYDSSMINILNSAVKTNVWQGSDGIITEGVSTTEDNDSVGFKGR
jgi:hypothetical protein